MYKKFLVSMLLTAALVGCNHQPSDKQEDQTDTTMPVQDQMVNPVNSSSSDEPIPVSPQAVEPNQIPPSDATPSTSTTTPTEPAQKDNSANSTTGGTK